MSVQISTSPDKAEVLNGTHLEPGFTRDYTINHIFFKLNILTLDAWSLYLIIRRQNNHSPLVMKEDTIKEVINRYCYKQEEFPL